MFYYSLLVAKITCFCSYVIHTHTHIHTHDTHSHTYRKIDKTGERQRHRKGWKVECKTVVGDIQSVIWVWHFPSPRMAGARHKRLFNGCKELSQRNRYLEKCVHIFCVWMNGWPSVHVCLSVCPIALWTLPPSPQTPGVGYHISSQWAQS